MAKTDQEYLTWLDNAIEYIVEHGLTAWEYYHHNHKYYTKVVLFLQAQLNRITDPMWGLPPDTTGWDIPQLCQWYVDHGKDFFSQNIPAQYYDAYKRSLEQKRISGVIRKRPLLRLNDANTIRQQAVRAIFKGCLECFMKQLNYTAITDPDKGFKSRGYWYDQAIASGQWYFNYFMQQTMDSMFGPEKPDRYPFTQSITPDWCIPNILCEKWEFTQFEENDFIFCLHNVTLPTGTNSLKINIMAEGDTTSPTPGNTETLKIHAIAQGINEEGEPTGDVGMYTLDPIGTGWKTAQVSFTTNTPSAGILIAIICNNGDGDYWLYFNDAIVGKNTGTTQLKIYGAPGNPFGWDIGQGAFSFLSFVEF